MGRNKEALQKYLLLEKLDSNFYRYNNIIIILVLFFLPRATKLRAYEYLGKNM
jgi:hypothetical protein